MNFYSMPIQRVLEIFKTDSTYGLTTEQVERALEKYGTNRRAEKVRLSFFTLLLQQAHDPLMYLLLASGVLLFFTGDRFDAYIISGILLLNAVVGAAQEKRIFSMAQKLQRFAQSNTLVVRDGKKKLVADELLVPGDIIIVQEGELIAADGRIVECYDFTTDESVITGESAPVAKASDPFMQDNLPLYKQKSMVFAGSSVLSGTARIVVTATGLATASGLVEQASQNFTHQMPLEKDLGFLLQFILWLIVGICTVLFIIGIATGKPFHELFAALLALFICVVPQGLPVIMTLILVSGAYRMARRNVLAKKLQAVEALGRAQVMIIDKTGTLTRNELMVEKIVSGNSLYTVSGKGYNAEGQVTHALQKVEKPFVTTSNDKKIFAAALLLDRSEVSFNKDKNLYSVKGNPTELALRIAAQKTGMTEQDVAAYKELFEIPFSAQYQYHVGFYEYEGKGILFGIGSPETIAQRCSFITKEQTEIITTLMQEGLRVISVAYKTFDLALIPQNKDQKRDFFIKLFEQDLELLGAFAIQDTLRAYAPDVIRDLKNAGLQIVMATGDNQDTAVQLARKAGVYEEGNTLVTGEQLQSMNDQEVTAQLARTAIYARVLPADKLRLVRLFQAQQKTTVMIGDGVNDAPALAAAQLGVALGNCGSEVAKDAADIILLDDAFESIIVGLSLGRHIFYTFIRVVMYFFTTNLAEILVMLFALGCGYPVPLVAAQILWLNLITDGFLDFSLSLEDPEPGLLRKTWLQEYPQLLTRSLIVRIFYMSFVTAGIACGIFIFYLSSDSLAVARTMTMVMLTVCQWINALSCRSITQSVFTRGIRSNKILSLILAIIIVGQLLILYVPFLQIIFKTTALTVAHWKVIIFFGILIFITEEIRKWYVRRFVS